MNSVYKYFLKIVWFPGLNINNEIICNQYQKLKNVCVILQECSGGIVL